MTSTVAPPATSRLAVFGPLRRARFRRMVTAQFVSEIGDGVTTVALPLYVYARTQSALATSLTFMAELLAGVVMGFVGGVLADAFDRQRVLVTSYLARGALLVATVAVGPLWLAVTFGVLARAGGQLDNPSFDAMVPEHADGDLQQVLAVRRFIQAVSYTVGPALGALAVTWVGPRQALLLDTATFLAAVALLAPVAGLDASWRDRKVAQAGQTIGDRASSMVDGIRVLVRTPIVCRLVGYWAIVMAGVAIVMAAAIIWFEEVLGVSDAWYGLAIAAYGSGATLGLVWAGSHRFRWPLPTILVLSAPIYAVASLLGVAVLQPWLLPVGWFIWGFAMGPEMVLGEVLLVESVPESLRGRAFAALGVLTMLGMAVGYGVAGPLIEAVGTRAAIAVTSVAMGLLALMWLGPSRTSRRAAPIRIEPRVGSVESDAVD